jgi:alginate O-acetyltransferase complex protein AlgI
MIFNTIAYYLLFLFPAAIAFQFAKPYWRPAICALFGCAFFVFFSLTAVGGVPGAFCLGIFLWESGFSRFYQKGSWLCWVGVAQSIVFLVIFKYWNFFTGLYFGQPAHNPLYWKGAFLPLGVSFFTFEFIHYAVDRHKGRTEAGTLGEYMSFILYFPTMVAGPIKRYQDFLPKVREPDTATLLNWRIGCTRILSGLVKKFAIADVMTAFTNHLNQADIAAAQRWVLPFWLLAYACKIYFDFSGYSDIAIGSARLFGIGVPENFNWPYFRTNIAEFWRNWHISLSRWLTDYVFIPLGGSRVQAVRLSVNLLVTMLVSGIWHGAGLNFLVWGLWHGALLVVHRIWTVWRAPSAAESSFLKTVLCCAGTFSYVTLGWAFFCMDLPTMAVFFRKLLVGQ